MTIAVLHRRYICPESNECLVERLPFNSCLSSCLCSKSANVSAPSDGTEPQILPPGLIYSSVCHSICHRSGVEHFGEGALRLSFSSTASTTPNTPAGKATLSAARGEVSRKQIYVCLDLDSN